MQQNFTSFNADATGIETKEYKGLTLVWSPEDQRYMLPLPSMELPQQKTLFDEPTGSFIQVTINDPAFIYRDRTATAPDGTVLQERIFIGRDRFGKQVEIPDPDFQKALLSSKIQGLKLQMAEAAQMTIPLFFIGVIVCAISFFWTLAEQAGMIAKSFATGSLTAMSEIGYLVAWVAGLLVLGVVLWFVVPAVFRAARRTAEPAPVAAMDAPKTDTQTTATNIVVNNIHGSGNTAQDFVSRKEV